jgi:hypothetical protein
MRRRRRRDGLWQWAELALDKNRTELPQHMPHVDAGGTAVSLQNAVICYLAHDISDI